MQIRYYFQYCLIIIVLSTIWSVTILGHSYYASPFHYKDFYSGGSDSVSLSCLYIYEVVINFLCFIIPLNEIYTLFRDIVYIMKKIAPKKWKKH